MIKKTMASLLVGTALVTSLPLSVSATEVEVIGGSAIISEDASIIELDIQEFNPLARQSIGTGRIGTWSHGNRNFGTTIFSTVIGNSGGAANTRADGLGTVVNGNGRVGSGEWQSPGIPSDGSILRTVTGTNQSRWNLRAPE